MKASSASYVYTASKENPMTFKDLRELVAECMKSDVPDEALIVVVNTLGGKVKTLTVKVATS